MKWPFYPTIYNGEALTSYMQRFSYENNIKPYDLWNFLLKENSVPPTRGNSSKLDCVPGNYISLEKFSKISGIKSEELNKLTFTTVLTKYGVDHNNIHQLKVLRGLLEFNRKYCPLCIAEKPFYRLIWQVMEIKYCAKHKVKLINQCPFCKKKIPSLVGKAQIGYCTECGSDLRQAELEYIPEKNLDQLNRSWQDWTFLLDPSKSIVTPIQGIKSINANIAAVKLYLDLGRPEVLKRSLIKNKSAEQRLIIEHIKPEEPSIFLCLSRLLKTLRKDGISFEEFSTIAIPPNFTLELPNISPKNNRVNLKEFICLSPWCKSYGKAGSISETSSYCSCSKDHVVGFRKYSCCVDCGVKYGINDNGQLVERGYMIELGWNKVLPGLKSGLPAKQLARNEGVNKSMVMRCVYYFIVRNLLPEGLEIKYTPKDFKRSMRVKLNY